MPLHDTLRDATLSAATPFNCCRGPRVALYAKSSTMPRLVSGWNLASREYLSVLAAPRGGCHSSISIFTQQPVVLETLLASVTLPISFLQKAIE